MNWQVALRLGRVSNLPTVWTNVLTGVVLAGGMQTGTVIWLALLSLSLFYVGGMYLNDAFDRESDRHERPERPIPSGLVPVQTVFAAGFGMLIAGLFLLAWAGYGIEAGTAWRAPASGLALASVIIFYDWYHKTNPLSPVVMGVCRVLVYFTAGLTVATSLPPSLMVAAAMLLSYLIGLTYIAKQEHLNRVRALWPLLFLLVPAVYTLPTTASSMSAAALYAAFVAWVLFALSFLTGTEDKSVPRAVASLLAGICLLDALLIAGHGAITFAWLAAAGFALTLVLQRFVPAT
ncbi:MAG: UbiA family prenyltransferase [Acidiferrobacterales bacterium]